MDIQIKKLMGCGHIDYEFKKGKCWGCSYPQQTEE